MLVSSFPFPVEAGLPAWCVKFWTDGGITLEAHAGSKHVITIAMTREEAAALAAALRWPDVLEVPQ